MKHTRSTQSKQVDPVKKPNGNMARSAALVIERHFGARPKKLAAIHGGLANHVFQAEVAGETVVLRISSSPEKLQVFMKEQWAVNAARRDKVPTPEILEVSNDTIGLPYMISRKVEGNPAQSVGQARIGILHELGCYAAVINGITTHDFGHIFDWSPNKLSRNSTWEEYLNNELHLEKRLEILRQNVLEPGNFKKLLAQVRVIQKWTAKPTLNHGDLRLKNVILNEKGKIRAIVDWENCQSHIAPCWELSIALHDLTVDEKQSFLDGYGVDLKQYTRMAPTIKAFNLLNYSRTVCHAVERKDQKRLAQLRARLNGAFDLYSL
jgi:hygromycin-B 4-O-kinase